MKIINLKIFTIILLVSITASPVFAQSTGKAYIRIVHLAPFAEEAGVTVRVNDDEILAGFGYGDSTQYIELDPGTYDIAITPTGGTTPAIEATINLVAQTYYTALAIGDDVNQPLDLLLLEDDLSAAAAGNFKLRLGHLAPFADTLAETRVDVRRDDGSLILDDVEFGGADVYQELPAGTYDLKITTPDGNFTLINLAPINFKNGQIYSIFAVGNGSIKSLGGYALPKIALGYFLPLEIARLQVAHLAPFDDPGTVDIKLNGVTALSGIVYGDSTPYIELAADSYLVEVFPEGSGTAAISEMVNLIDGNDYTAIAIGDGVNQPLGLKVLLDDNNAPSQGNFKLRLGHLAPFDDDLPGTTAEVRKDDGTLILDDVVFGDVDIYKELPAGSYDLKVTTPDGDITLINLAPVDFAAGQIFSVFAVGDGDIQPLGGYALPADAEGFFLSLDVARLQVAHLAPFGDPGTVDISLNSEPVPALQDFNYGDSTPYIELSEGSYDVEIFPDGSSTAVITETISLTGGNDYTAIATGDGVNQPLSLMALLDDNAAPAAGMFKLRLGHLAPFADELAETLADVRTDDGIVILDDVEFGDIDIYQELPVGTYDLQITTPDGGSSLIDLAPVTFTEGQILSAFAVGNGTIQALGGYGLPSGVEGFFLTLEEHFSYFFPLFWN